MLHPYCKIKPTPTPILQPLLSAAFAPLRLFFAQMPAPRGSQCPFASFDKMQEKSKSILSARTVLQSSYMYEALSKHRAKNLALARQWDLPTYRKYPSLIHGPLSLE